MPMAVKHSLAAVGVFSSSFPSQGPSVLRGVPSPLMGEGRYGGETFAVRCLYLSLSPQGAKENRKTLVSLVAGHRFISEGDILIFATIQEAVSHQERPLDACYQKVPTKSRPVLLVCCSGPNWRTGNRESSL